MAEKKTKEPAAERTVRMLLPEEGNGSHIDGCINGVNFRIRTGVPVDVPERIALLLEESRREMARSSRGVSAYTVSGGKRING